MQNMLKKLSQYRLLLASNSPRRQQFLRDIGLDFEVISQNIDESYPTTLKEEEITAFVAQKKASFILKNLQQNDILITSDTLVALPNIILGKPQNKEQAQKYLELLSGGTHRVYTSICLSTPSQQVTYTDCSEVTFNPLETSEIDFYIEKFQPFDKAGAYAVQEWIGHIGIRAIKGSYNNIVGLPTDLLWQGLKKITTTNHLEQK